MLKRTLENDLPNVSAHTHLTRLEPQRDATCSNIFHNINTVEPWRDWSFYRWARGRQLPWLCASCTEEQGAVLPGQVQGRHSGGPGVCVSEERQRAHTAGCPWERSNRREIHQWEEQPLWGVRQCKDTQKFPQQMLDFSEISLDIMLSHFWKDTTHFHPKTISGNIIRGVILRLASTTVSQSEENPH